MAHGEGRLIIKGGYTKAVGGYIGRYLQEQSYLYFSVGTLSDVNGCNIGMHRLHGIDNRVQSTENRGDDTEIIFLVFSDLLDQYRSATVS